MDSNSFTEATGKVLRILPKLYAGTVRMQYAQEHGMLAEANMIAFENYRHAEALTLCYRMIPTYTGLPYAKKEVERIMAEEVPFEIGFTDEGWFSVRFPRMLPKKEKGGVEYIRGQLYPALQRFFQNEYPVRFDDCVIIYRHVYAEGFPERKKRDHDNIETNEITDAIALFVMTDDAPKCCQHHHCSAAGPAERTEVYVVPEKDFIKWYEAAKTFPEEGVKLRGQRSIFDEKTVPKPGKKYAGTKRQLSIPEKALRL